MYYIVEWYEARKWHTSVNKFDTHKEAMAHAETLGLLSRKFRIMEIPK